MRELKKFLSLVIIALVSFVTVGTYNVNAYSTGNIENEQRIKEYTTSIDDNSDLGKIITSKNDTVYQDSDENIVSGSMITSTLNIGSSVDKGKFIPNSAASNGVEVGRVNWHLSNEFAKGKSQFTFHIDSIIGANPSFIDVTLEVVIRNGVTDNPQPYGKELLNFNADEITPGASKSMSVESKTAYFTVCGNFVVGAPDGNPKYAKISPSTILINRGNQYFPNYTDPVSKKQAVTGVRTDWEYTGSRPWNGREAYKRDFQAQYGVQPSSYWSSVQIHHIRPRSYGGNDSYDNLMPVKSTDTSHSKITTWFLKYK